MSVTIETGSIVANSDSYATETELGNYADAIGVSLSGDETELLTKASRFMKTLSYGGTQLTAAQSMPFPRSGMRLNGFYVGVDEIPTMLKDLQLEIAIAIDKGTDPTSKPKRLASSVKVGSIAQSFSDSGFKNVAFSEVIERMIQDLGGGTLGGSTFEVGRG